MEKQYQWLLQEKAPRMLVESLKLYGTTEVSGKGNNPIILKWAAEIGGNVAHVFLADDTPWCGLDLAIVAKRAGKELPQDPLWALNWGTFGTYTETPMLGDVLVFVRTTKQGTKAGHVGLYVFETRTAYGVLGGNQGDTHGITLISKSRLYTARRPIYSKGQPANVRRIFKETNGTFTNKLD